MPAVQLSHPSTPRSAPVSTAQQRRTFAHARLVSRVEVWLLRCCCTLRCSLTPRVSPRSLDFAARLQFAAAAIAAQALDANLRRSIALQQARRQHLLYLLRQLRDNPPRPTSAPAPSSDPPAASTGQNPPSPPTSQPSRPPLCSLQWRLNSRRLLLLHSQYTPSASPSATACAQPGSSPTYLLVGCHPVRLHTCPHCQPVSQRLPPHSHAQQSN